MTFSLRILKDTVLKIDTRQSRDLSPEEKINLCASNLKDFPLHSHQAEGVHYKVAFESPDFRGRNTWYVFGRHVQFVKNRPETDYFEIEEAFERQAGVKLRVPFKSQLDNWYNPTGSCNVTSLAMVLEFLGAERGSSEGQFEDELYSYALDSGYSRHSPLDLAQIVRDYGCKDDFVTDASLQEVRHWIDSGNPAVIHGYFTSFGHIVTVVGYDDAGLIVHDPYGEWFATGYRTDLSGAFLHYSDDLIAGLAFPMASFGFTLFRGRLCPAWKSLQERFLSFLYSGLRLIWL